MYMYVCICIRVRCKDPGEVIHFRANVCHEFPTRWTGEWQHRRGHRPITSIRLSLTRDLRARSIDPGETRSRLDLWWRWMCYSSRMMTWALINSFQNKVIKIIIIKIYRNKWNFIFLVKEDSRNIEKELFMIFLN